MESEFQRPISRVLTESIPAQSMAIAPDARRERAEMSSGRTP